MARFLPLLHAAAAAAILSGMGCGQSASHPRQVTVRTVTAEQIHGMVAAGTDTVTLLHFWATWCPPCVKEFPDIVALAGKYRDSGLQVLLVSADAEGNLSVVTRFLAEQGVTWQTYLAANVNDSFIQAISPKWSGALPASFYYSAEGTLLESWEGSRPYAMHEEAVLAILKEQR